MGSRVKLKSDPALAQAHAAGAKVFLNQPCLHDKFGPLFVRQVPHFQLHLAYAKQLRAELDQLDAQVESLKVETSGGRHVNDPLLVARLYVVGTTMAVHTVLAFQHLVLDLESLAPANTGTADVTARFSTVIKRLGNRIELKTDVDYARLCEIVDVRHSIEHPTRDNIYTANTNKWDSVPLTWIASGRAASAFDAALRFLNAIAAFREKTQKRRSKGPGVFLNVTRGIRASNPARKPRV